MKKRWFETLILTSVALSLVACSLPSNSSRTGGEEAAATTSEHVLTIPTFYVGENVGAVYFVPAVERFNKANQGKYRIELEEVVEASYADKMSQLAQSKMLPALIQVPSSEWIQTVMIPSRLYYPMNDFLDTNPAIKELCVESSLDFCTQENGDIVSVPAITLSNIGLFYNTKLYQPEKAVSSMTFEEFRESFGDRKIAFQTVDNAWTSALFLTALIANEDGGEEWLLSYDGGKCLDFNQKPFIEAVRKFKEIWSKNAADTSVGAAYADAANTFMSKNAALIANGSWMNSEFAAQASGNWSNGFSGESVKADYYPGNIAICDTAVYGRWTLTTEGSEQDREVAEAFLAFLFSKEELETFATTEGCQVPNLEYSDDFFSALSEKALVKEQTELLTSETKIVPNVLNIMLDSVATGDFGTNLVPLINGEIDEETFCNILTKKSIEASEN